MAPRKARRVQALPGHQSMDSWERLLLAKRRAGAGAAGWGLCWGGGGGGCQRAARSRSCRAPWPRRKMELAVREEDYATAAEAKTEVDMLRERLPSDKLVLASLLERVEGHVDGRQQPGGGQGRQAAIRQLGDLGDMAACPALSTCLHDSDASTAEAAEEALWAIFKR